MKTAHLSASLFIILTVAMLLFCMPNLLLADDHGDDFSHATFTSVGSSISGSIDPSGDIDYFEFTVSQTAIYVIYTRGITDTLGGLYDANYSILESDRYSGEDDNFRIERSLTPGTYYVMVRGGYDYTTGNYELHLEGPGAGTVSDDHGFSPWSASAVTVGSITDGSIDVPDDRDYFEFTVSQTAIYVIYTRGITDTLGGLYDANYSILESDRYSGEDDNFRIERSLTPGTYYVMVRGGYDYTTGNYELHLEGPGVTPGHLDHFSFSTISSPQTVGTPFQVTVSARDASGELISSFNGSVSLGASSGQIYPPEIYVSNGVGTTDKVKLYSAGAMYLTAQGYGMYGRSNFFDVTGQGAMIGNLTGVVRDGNGIRLTGAAVWLSRTKDGWDYQVHTTNGNYEFTDISCDNYYYVWAEYDGARSPYHPVKVPCSNRTMVENITVVKCNPQGKTPVLLVPGIMGSTSKYKGGGYPVLPKDPPLWDSGRLVLLDPAGIAGWTDLIEDHFNEEEGYQLGCNLFQVPYDWRMDIDQAWKQYLKKWIDEAKRITGSPKVNIVAHSMGGLLTRAYIQSEDYDYDIDRFAMVGTPNYGAATAYYLWEGGDPYLADQLNEPWYMERLNLNFYSNTINKMYDTYYNESVFIDLGILGFCKRDKIFDMIQKHGESVHQLMPTYDDPLSTGAIMDPDSINTFLINLNNSPNTSRMVHDNSQDPDKVMTWIFGGKAKDTIKTVNVGKPPGNKFYPDGAPKGKPSYDNLGDGTVLTKSLQGPFALIPEFKQGSHSGLIKTFAGDIFEFITGSQPLQKVMAAAQPASVLAIQINGRASGYVQSPGGLENGIKEGALVEEIPGTEVLFSPDAGYIKIENPSEGAYSVILNSPYQEDFGIDLMYGNDQDIINRQMIVFSHGAPFTFSFTLDIASDEKITIQHTPETPTDLKADAVGQGGLKTRLSWNISSGASSYRIYAKNQGEPYLQLLGTTSSLSFNTGDEWAYDASITTRFYAVSAVNVQNAESFLSDMVKNDDRDHDGLTDVKEATAGSNPDNPDSDGDGLLDGNEYNKGTNPLVQDTDGDGYSDYDEVVAGTDPLDENSVPTCPDDANGDGSINVQDVICIINVILDTGTASGNPDCNEDGSVNVLDVICVINKILEG